MTLQVDFWQLVSVLAGLVVAFISFCGGGGMLLLRVVEKHLDERFATQEKARADGFIAQEKARAEAQAQIAGRLDAMEQVARDEMLQWQRVEREFLKFQADMPMKYVMRDDYIRGQSIVEAKLDGLADKIEKAQLRGIIAGGRT